MLGYDPSTVTPEQLTEVEDLLTQMLAQANSVSPSFGDMTTLLVSGDIVACWQGWAYMNRFAAAAGKDTVKTSFPRRAASRSPTRTRSPPTVDNLDTAHAWINQVLDPQANAEAAIYLVAGVTVEAAPPLLDEATAALYDYRTSTFFATGAPLQQPAGGVGRVRHDRAVAGTLAGGQGQRRDP